ncbi:MAG: M23 family metallopeptidase [Rhodospirillaceae bacterium]|nr:M23 family metallopeptidase [Rhodospirillaceae bacterium]
MRQCQSILIVFAILAFGLVPTNAQDQRPGEDIEVPEPKDPPKVHPSCEKIASDFGSMLGNEGQPRSLDVPHSGIDLNVPEGTPILAASHGRVVYAGNSPWGGKVIRIYHGTRDWQGRTLHLFSSYVHMIQNDVVKPGDDVRRGTLIGYSGNTGIATTKTPHLHFAVQINIDGVIEIEEGRIATAKTVNPHLFWFRRKADKQYIGFLTEPREQRPYTFDGKFRNFTYPVTCPG